MNRLLTVTLRYSCAIAIVGLFMFPIFWWGLTSIKPISAIFDKDTFVILDFVPTLDNYRTVLAAGWGSTMDGRPAILSSTIIASGSTLLTVMIALLAAYSLSRLLTRHSKHYVYWMLLQRLLPPVAIVIPLIFIFRDVGLYNTHFGLIIAHTLLNLPIALLLLKSFMDDIPLEIDQAAMIDGASRLQVFWKVLVPLIKGGISATAVLCFIFSWTEFLLSVFLSSTLQTIPVKITTFASWTFGYSSALGTAAILPSFLFILLFQRHLVRGLTLGAIKD